MKLDIAPVLESHLVELLKNASILGEGIIVTEWNRGIGKSTALVNFAKEFGFTVVVPNMYQVESLKKYTGYDKIIKVSDIVKQGSTARFVYDEGVSPSEFTKLNVATGFIRV